METDQKPQTLYRCKRCRRIVAVQENVILHKQGEGERCFKWKKRGASLDSDKKPECSSIFVEPMKWMQAVQEGHVEEKLCAWAARLVWVHSTGQACSAAVELG